MNKIIRCVFNADLRCAHDGLSQMLKKSFKIDTGALEVGEYVVCINSAKTIVKIYAAGNTIAHYKSTRGRIDLKTLQYIPRYFNGAKFNYEGALLEAVLKELNPVSKRGES